MRSNKLLPLAVGLLGLNLAVATPCRPQTPVSTPDATPSITSTPSATPIETPSETPTSTIVESSTTPSAPLTIPTAFNIVASTGPAADKVLRGRLIDTSYITFDNSLRGDISLAWEESTGRLRASSNLYLCGRYNLQPLTGSIMLCSAEQGIRANIPASRWDEETVVGEPGTDEEGLTYTRYTQVLDPDSEPWSNFYSRRYTGSPDLQWHADIGPEGAATTDSTLTPIEFLVQAI